MNILQISADSIGDIQAGEMVNLNGYVYTIRDKALSRLAENRPPDFLNNAIVYFAGPTMENEKGMFSCGPTTSQRMYDYIPYLFECGVKAIIGKGNTKREAFLNNGIYMLALGGCGALYGSRIHKKETIKFGELGAEAIYRMKVKDFPVIIAIDSKGKSINTIGSKDE